MPSPALLLLAGTLEASVVPTLPRPAPSPRWCSRAVCVHAPPQVDQAIVRDVHAAVEGAVRDLPLLDLPPLLPDGGRGGSFALDVYLSPRAEGAAAWADPPVGAFDRSSAFVAAPAVASGPPCALRHHLTRAVVQGSLLGLDAAAHDGVLALQGGHLANLLAPCPGLWQAAFDTFQRRPERAWLPSSRPLATGASWVAERLDERYGAGFGTVSTSLFALGAQRSPTGLPVYRNEPDWFDVLRFVLPPRGTTVGGFLLDIAIDRAFVGDRGYRPDSHPELGALGRPRFEWAVTYESLPRRLGPRRPLEPTGAAYIWVDTADAAPDRGLWIIADHEVQRVVTWAALTIDDDGRITAKYVFGGVFGASRAELTLERLDGAAGVLLVASHEGSDDRSHPYDPDAGPPRPAGWEVTLRPR